MLNSHNKRIHFIELKDIYFYFYFYSYLYSNFRKSYDKYMQNQKKRNYFTSYYQMIKKGKISTISQLMNSLMNQYNIKPISVKKSPPVTKQSSQYNHLKNLYQQKNNQCEQLKKKFDILTEQNERLKIKIAQIESERDREIESSDIRRLRQKLYNYEGVFKQEQKMILQLKQMLDKKQIQVDNVIEEYESKIQMLTHKLQKNIPSDKTIDYIEEIKELNELLKQQEEVMLQLLQKNKVYQAQLNQAKGRSRSREYEIENPLYRSAQQSQSLKSK